MSDRAVRFKTGLEKHPVEESECPGARFPRHLGEQMKFHEGELAVQEQLGVRAIAERVGNIIQSHIPEVAQDWLRHQRLAAATTIAADQSIWVSLLTGQAGFLEPFNQSLRLHSALDDDVLQRNLATDEAIGLVVLEPATRKRMRLNGTAKTERNGLLVSARQVYSNCPKYIQARHVVEAGQVAARVRRMGVVLREEQRQLIESADTFFIGSSFEGNADASHRGGSPGFVRVESESCLSWLDYPGNAMFNTFGNLHLNPRCGLLFIDWETGRTLQLSGIAILKHHGSQVTVKFHPARWIEALGASPLRWQLDDFSPFNPAV
jgi:predicted pyridoxine 5'-phosphate oxidase superfamily flavin-nucleotide-binding protein